MVYFRYLLNVIGLSAVFVICVGLRCVLATWFKPRWPARPRPLPRSLHGEGFSISCCIRLHLLRWRRLAGQNRRRLRSRLSKNEGAAGRTPCGECGEPIRRGGYSLSYIRVAREFLEVGRAGCASLLFSAG